MEMYEAKKTGHYNIRSRPKQQLLKGQSAYSGIQQNRTLPIQWKRHQCSIITKLTRNEKHKAVNFTSCSILSIHKEYPLLQLFSSP